MLDCVVDLKGMLGNAGYTYYWDVAVQSGGVVDRCVIRNYKYTGDANGGASTSHRAVTVEGGGVFRNSLVQDCEVTANVDSGVSLCAVQVTGAGTMENCTIVNSKGRKSGSGLRITAAAGTTPVIRNNIVWGSTAVDGASSPDVYDSVSPSAPRITYSCSPDLTTGVEISCRISTAL